MKKFLTVKAGSSVCNDHLTCEEKTDPALGCCRCIWLFSRRRGRSLLSEGARIVFHLPQTLKAPRELGRGERETSV